MMDSEQVADLVAVAIILGFALFYAGMEFTNGAVAEGVTFGLQLVAAVMVLVALFHLFGDSVPAALGSLRELRSKDAEDRVNVSETPDEDPRDNRDG